MPVPIAVVDANVLYSIELTDVLMTTATHQLVRLHWSVEILDEVRRNLQQRPQLSEEAIDYRIDRMNTALPDALAAVRADLAASMPVNEKDRHVLALAVDLEANLIVTSNLRDFPTDACQPDGVEAMTPDQLLTAIAASDPLAVRDELGEITARRTRPAMTPGELLDRLAGRLPEFAARTGAVAGSSRLTVRKRAGSSVRENFRGGLIGGLARRTSADRGAPARKKSLLDGHARTPVNGLEGVHTVEVRRSRRLSPTARDGLIGRGEWPGRWRSMVPADDVVGRDPEPVLDAVGQAAPVEAGAFQVSFTCREPTPVAGATPLAPHAPRARQHLNTSVARGRRPLAGSDARHQGFV